MGMSVAKAEFMYEKTREYILDRKAFGAPIAKMQFIRHQMAELKTKITIGRAFTDQCVELHGGWGYMWEYDVCRAYVDARVQRIYGGTNEIMKEIIARDIPYKK